MIVEGVTMASIQLKVNAVTSASVPAATVLRVTDTAQGKPVGLDKSFWFTLESANDVARQQSAMYPKPQRCLVFNSNDVLIASWQCGKELPLFWVE